MKLLDDFIKIMSPKPSDMDFRPMFPVTKYDAAINKISGAHGLDPAFIKSVINQESKFNERAISQAGAKGLMQLMPRTAKYLKVKDPYNPHENITAGTKYLASLVSKFGSHELALAAYNGGEGRLRKNKFDINKMPQETKQYVQNVMNYYRKGF